MKKGKGRETIDEERPEVIRGERKRKRGSGRRMRGERELEMGRRRGKSDLGKGKKGKRTGGGKENWVKVTWGEARVERELEKGKENSVGRRRAE